MHFDTEFISSSGYRGPTAFVGPDAALSPDMVIIKAFLTFLYLAPSYAQNNPQVVSNG